MSMKIYAYYSFQGFEFGVYYSFKGFKIYDLTLVIILIEINSGIKRLIEHCEYWLAI